MINVEPIQKNQDSTVFGIFPRNLPIETVLQHGGDHLKASEREQQAPPLRATRSAFSSPHTLPIWQDEYKR